MPFNKFEFMGLDSKESIFFENELQSIMAETYLTLYPLLKYSTSMPVVSEFPNSEEIGYDMYDQVGKAKVAKYTDDIPRSDVKGERTLSYVKPILSCYGYDIIEIRQAMQLGKPLDRLKSDSARRSIEVAINEGAWKAHSTEDYPSLYGFLYHTGVTSYKCDVETAAYLWSAKTAGAIIKDINRLVNTPIILTHGMIAPNTFKCPVTQWALISTTQAVTGSDKSILQFCQAANPHITDWGWLEELATVNPIPSTGVASDVSVAIAYNNDPMCFKCLLPQPFEQLAPQIRNYETIVNCHSRFGGVTFMQPLSAAIVESI
jgi:hypothetical protein